MAEGILRMVTEDEFEAFSAGAKATRVHPLAVEVMGEVGVDISSQKSKSVTGFANQEFDYVITLCGENAKRACPVFIGGAKHRLHWDFLDPAEAEESREQELAVFRTVRDQIKARIEKFAQKIREQADEYAIDQEREKKGNR